MEEETNGLSGPEEGVSRRGQAKWVLQEGLAGAREAHCGKRPHRLASAGGPVCRERPGTHSRDGYGADMDLTLGGEGRGPQWSLGLPDADSADPTGAHQVFPQRPYVCTGLASLPQGPSKASRNFCDAVAEALTQSRCHQQQAMLHHAGPGLGVQRTPPCPREGPLQRFAWPRQHWWGGRGVLGAAVGAGQRQPTGPWDASAAALGSVLGGRARQCPCVRAQ